MQEEPKSEHQEGLNITPESVALPIPPENRVYSYPDTLPFMSAVLGFQVIASMIVGLSCLILLTSIHPVNDVIAILILLVSVLLFLGIWATTFKVLRDDDTSSTRIGVFRLFNAFRDAMTMLANKTSRSKSVISRSVTRVLLAIERPLKVLFFTCAGVTLFLFVAVIGALIVEYSGLLSSNATWIAMTDALQNILVVYAKVLMLSLIGLLFFSFLRIL